MKAFTVKQTANQDKMRGRMKNNHIPLFVRANIAPNLKLESSIIKRKPNCACGGGCPKCLGTLGVQTKHRIGVPNDIYGQESGILDEPYVAKKGDNIVKIARKLLVEQGIEPTRRNVYRMQLLLDQKNHFKEYIQIGEEIARVKFDQDAKITRVTGARARARDERWVEKKTWKRIEEVADQGPQAMLDQLLPAFEELGALTPGLENTREQLQTAIRAEEEHLLGVFARFEKFEQAEARYKKDLAAHERLRREFEAELAAAPPEIKERWKVPQELRPWRDNADYGWRILTDGDEKWHNRVVAAPAWFISELVAFPEDMLTGVVEAPSRARVFGELLAKSTLIEEGDEKLDAQMAALMEGSMAVLGAFGPFTGIKPGGVKLTFGRQRPKPPSPGGNSGKFADDLALSANSSGKPPPKTSGSSPTAAMDGVKSRTAPTRSGTPAMISGRPHSKGPAIGQKTGDVVEETGGAFVQVPLRQGVLVVDNNAASSFAKSLTKGKNALQEGAEELTVEVIERAGKPIFQTPRGSRELLKTDHIPEEIFPVLKIRPPSATEELSAARLFATLQEAGVGGGGFGAKELPIIGPKQAIIAGVKRKPATFKTKGFTDKVIVAEAMVAGKQAGIVPVFVTADGGVIKGLARIAAKNDPALRWLGRGTKEIRAQLEQRGLETFTVKIDGFLLKVRPVILP